MSRWQKLALIAITAIGVVAGVLAAWGGPADTTGEARHIPAASPAVPFDPNPVIVPDPGVAPLATGLPLKPTTIGERFSVRVSVPERWRKEQSNYNEYLWEPEAQPAFAYQLRVEQVSAENLTMDEIVASRRDRLDDRTQDFELISSSPDTLVFSFVLDKHQRFGMRRWVAVPGTVTAGVEIAVEGREEDLPGLADLMERVAATVVQPEPR